MSEGGLSLCHRLRVEWLEVGAQMGDRIDAKMLLTLYLTQRKRTAALIYTLAMLLLLYDPSFRFSLFIIS